MVWEQRSPRTGLIFYSDRGAQYTSHRFQRLLHEHSVVQSFSSSGKPHDNAVVRYLEDGRLELSNNRAERSIKPFVMGRKNWLFANTPAGAQSSAVIYSLIETAKENGLDPYRYLVWLLYNRAWAEPNGCSLAKGIPSCKHTTRMQNS